MNKLEEKVDGMLQGEGLPDMNAGNYSDARIIQVRWESKTIWGYFVFLFEKAIIQIVHLM
jgi:hypothetical protein